MTSAAPRMYQQNKSHCGVFSVKHSFKLRGVIHDQVVSLCISARILLFLKQKKCDTESRKHRWGVREVEDTVKERV